MIQQNASRNLNKCPKLFIIFSTLYRNPFFQPHLTANGWTVHPYPRSTRGIEDDDEDEDDDEIR